MGERTNWIGEAQREKEETVMRAKRLKQTELRMAQRMQMNRSGSCGCSHGLDIDLFCRGWVRNE